MTFPKLETWSTFLKLEMINQASGIGMSVESVLFEGASKIYIKGNVSCTRDVKHED